MGGDGGRRRQRRRNGWLAREHVVCVGRQHTHALPTAASPMVDGSARMPWRHIRRETLEGGE